MEGEDPGIGKNPTLERLRGSYMGVQVSSMPRKAHGRVIALERHDFLSIGHVGPNTIDNQKRPPTNASSVSKVLFTNALYGQGLGVHRGFTA